MTDEIEDYKFEEVVKPVSNEIEPVEFYCVTTDKSQIKDIFSIVSRKYPMKDEVANSQLLLPIVSSFETSGQG